MHISFYVNFATLRDVSHMHHHTHVSVSFLHFIFLSVCMSLCINPCWTNCLLLTELTSRPYKRNWVSSTWLNNRGNDWKPSLPRKPRLESWRMKNLTPFVSWVLETEEWSTRSATNPRVWSWLGRWKFTSSQVSFICIAQCHKSHICLWGLYNLYSNTNILCP